MGLEKDSAKAGCTIIVPVNDNLLDPFNAAMPSSLHFDSTLPPKLDINVGARSHFFRPPRTPSASSSLHQSRASSSFHDVSGGSSRKRSRHDSSLRDQTMPFSAGPPASMVAADTAGAQSPPPFVNTKYELAGGLDTPTATMSLSMELSDQEYEANPDLHLRGGRGSRSCGHLPDDHVSLNPLALAKEGNGRSRLPAQPPIRDGLGRMVYGVVGMAGRVLEFCKVTAFKGFYAGGGQGYQMKPSAQMENIDQSVWLDDDVFQSYKRRTALVPGQFPDEDYIPNYMSQDHTTPPRASKKIQREKGSGEISASWVLLDGTSSRDASPSRLSHRKLPSAAAQTRRPAPKYGRRPVLPASRRSLTSYAGSPGLQSDRPTSSASTRSPISSTEHKSPITNDLQRHAAKLRRRELEEDANLKRLNLQLKAMIKEGKEALGTKFEVQEEPIDEDYAGRVYFNTVEKG